MVYAIYEEFYPEVEKKLKRIAKKCIKHGNDFTFKVDGEEIRAIKNNDTDRMEYYKFILVNVEGTAKIDNWECIAVIEVHEVGNIIRRINTDIEIPDRFKHSENICEHCNSKRHRNNLYVIHNTETNEWKQVGGNCLNLYTNGLSLEYVTAYLDGITELEENNGVIEFGRGKAYYRVEDVIAMAVEIIEKTGYFNSQSDLPTKSLVSIMLNRHDIKLVNERLTDYRFNVYFTDNDFHKEETEDTVNKIIEYYLSVNDDSEFTHNIHVMLNEGYINPKNLGYLCYLPEGYAKHLQREIERAKRLEEKNEHFGEIGKRYKDKVINSVELLTSWYTDFGVTRLYKIVLDDGLEEDLEEPIKAALKHDILEINLTEYFYKIFDDRGIMATFDELLTLIEMFAEECAALEYDARPKAWTYARCIAALIASLEFDEDQQRAINFLEDPADRFENFIGAH